MHRILNRLLLEYKYIKMKQLVLFLFFSSQCLINIAQTITGKITDENHNPLSFANVVLINAKDSAFVTGTVSKEDGTFLLQASTNKDYILKVSLVGYVTNYSKYKLSEARTIVMIQQSQLLKDVVVKAERSMFQQRDGSLITRVEGSLLSRKPSMEDLFASIPGVVRTSTGTMEVFGLGEPVYYINNRKVQNQSEIQNLDPKNIKNIELITNPGAKYDAEGKAVLKITTLEREDGYTGLIKSSATLSERFTHNEGLTIGYKKKKLSVSATYSFLGFSNKMFQPQTKEIYSGQNIYSEVLDQQGRQDQKSHSWDLALDYQLSAKQIIGIKWDGFIRRNEEWRYTQLDYKLNEALLEHSDISNNYHNRTSMHHVNAFYYVDWSKKLSTQFIADYVNNQNKYNQFVDEIVSDSAFNTTSHSHGTFNIYAVKQTIDYKFDSHHTLSWGLDYNQVKGSGILNSSSSIVSASDYIQKENKLALFAEYSYNHDIWSFISGLRYEMYHSDYKDKIEEKNNIHRIYNNLFPSMTLGYHKGLWSHSLSFSSKITRPTFRQLSNNNYYSDEFTYQQGNPRLKPSISYLAQWQSSYRFINLSASYNYTKDITLFDMYVSENNPQVIVSTYNNFGHIHYLKLNLNIQKKIGNWHPTLSMGLSQPFLKTSFRDETIHHNKAQFYAVADQSFMLPKDYILSAYYYYCNGGAVGLFSIKPYQEFNLSLTKSLFHNRLDMSIAGNDLFHKMKYRENGYLTNIHFTQTEDYRLWNYSISIKYKFNNIKTKFRGASAVNNEINRL